MLLLLLELAVLLEELGVRGMGGIGELLLQSTQLGINGFAALLLRLQLTLESTTLLSRLLLTLVVLRSRCRLRSLRLPLHGCGGSWVAGRSAVLTVALLQPIVDTADVLGHMARAELVDTRHQAVEELAVVRDDDDRAREVKDGFLQDVLRADVEVVRRLVENEEVCGAEEELDKGYATTLAPTEDGDLLLRLLTAEHKGPEEVIDA